jgi:REP element-mobilizing transposase RayT
MPKNMSDTYSRMYIQIVFAVKHRQSLISESWSEELRKYITGIVQNKGHKMLAIGTMPDHIHLFIQYKPHMSLSDLVKEVKRSSTHLINEKRWSNFKFQWQEGFGAFSYNKEDISNVCNYVENQKEHHRKKSFKEEYVSILDEFCIEYKEEYLFDWVA